MHQTLVISQKAFSQMAKDCLKHEASETGGVLVGRIVAGHVFVPFVISAGDRAGRSMTGFAPDSGYQQPFLDFLADRFPGTDYVGDWHRHPGGMDRPSTHDLVTATRILKDESWGKEAACFPILTVRDGRVHMRSYLITREDPTFAETAIEVVPDSDPRMVAVLTGTVPIRPLEDHHEHIEVPPHRCRRGAPHRRFPWPWRGLRQRQTV